MSFWGKVEYAYMSGMHNVVKDYTLKDAAKDIGLAKGDAYAKAVKAGLITAGKVGRIAAKAVPVVSWVSSLSDAGKFVSGFITGWQMYGYRNAPLGDFELGQFRAS